jgi:hypothetical protein
MAKKPIFEGITNIRVRCLIAVGVGCDMYLKGVPGITPKFVSDLLKNFREQHKPEDLLYEFIMDQYLVYHFQYSKKATNNVVFQTPEDLHQYKLMLNVFVYTMAYEPTNVITCIDNVGINVSNKNTYIISTEIPNSFHYYLKEFCRGDTVYVKTFEQCRNDIAECVGPGNGPHIFMHKEGIHTCNECKKTMCYTCSFTDGHDEYCVDCYAGTQFVTVSELDSNKTTEEMMDDIIGLGYQVTSNDKPVDILDTYDTIIVKQEGIYNKCIIDNVIYPSERTSYLNTLEPISQFDLCHGGCFIGSKEFSLDQVIELLSLFRELVNIRPVVTPIKTDETRTHSVIPTMLIDFALKSRAEFGGYRLLKRCICHALDTSAIDITLANVKVVSINSSLALVLQHQVKASMKSDVYNARVCFNKTHLYCCECDCKCGSQDT